MPDIKSRDKTRRGSVRQSIGPIGSGPSKDVSYFCFLRDPMPAHSALPDLVSFIGAIKLQISPQHSTDLTTASPLAGIKTYNSRGRRRYDNRKRTQQLLVIFRRHLAPCSCLTSIVSFYFFILAPQNFLNADQRQTNKDTCSSWVC